jgi:hypothetical protein
MFIYTNITIFSFLLLPRYISLTAEFIEVKRVYFSIVPVIKVVLKMDDLWVETSWKVLCKLRWIYSSLCEL